MTKREFGNIIREARIKKGLLLREMDLGAMRHSRIEAGDFEIILYHERKALCNQLSLDRKEIDDFANQLDFSEKVNSVTIEFGPTPPEEIAKAVAKLTGICAVCGKEHPIKEMERIRVLVDEYKGKDERFKGNKLYMWVGVCKGYECILELKRKVEEHHKQAPAQEA